MAYSEEIEALKLFNEKSDKLFASRYVKYLQETKKLSVGFTFTKGQAPTTRRALPDQDAIDAFVLTFRFFIQDNDKISFHNIGKLYEEIPISSELKKRFVEQRKVLNDYLDKQSNNVINGLNLTQRQILAVFVYGGLAHANAKKKAIYDTWKADGLIFPILELHFCSILEFVQRIINNVFIINKEAINELEKQHDILKK